MTEQPDNSDSTPVTDTRARPNNAVRLAQAAALGGIVTLTVVLTLWIARDNDPSGIEILIPTPAPVTFQISGEVMEPGVYSLDGNPRINDAIDIAGGLTPNADDQRINLALRVRDGAKIVIPGLALTADSGTSKTGEVGDSASSSGDPKATGSSDTTITFSGSPVNDVSSGLIDLNTATKDQLILLPGVGDVRADSIIEWRANNLISAVSDLLAISGIGPSTVDSIRDHVIQP